MTFATIGLSAGGSLAGEPVREVFIAIDNGGASAAEIERWIVVPIERTLTTVAAVQCVRSVSTDGRARLVVSVAGLTDQDAKATVETALRHVEPRQLATMAAPVITVQSPYSRLVPCFTASMGDGAGRSIE